MKKIIGALIVLTGMCHASLPLYQQAIQKNIQLLEKTHSVPHVIKLLSSLPITIQLDIVYQIILASKVFTILEREEILTWFINHHEKNISATDNKDLLFIKEKFLKLLKIIHKGPRLTYLVAGPNAQLCDKKSTLLIKASAAGRQSLVRKLIELGANPNQQDAQGFTALFFVADAPTAQILLAAKANVNHVDIHGSTPLFYEDNPDVLALLVAHGASLTHFNNYAQNALAFHAENNSVKAINALLKLGAPINQRNEDGLTALDIALDDITIDAETIDFLIDKGAKTAQELEDEEA